MDDQNIDIVPILNGKLNLDIAQILSDIHVEPGDIVVLGGTLIEGIGNPLSDLDLYVLTPERRKFGAIKDHNHAFYHRPGFDLCDDDDDEVFLTMNYYEGSIHVDVEYWSFEELEEIVDKMNRFYQGLLTHTDCCYETPANAQISNMLHRLFTGIVIYGDGTYLENVLSAQFRQSYCYILYRYFANFYWRFRDIVGAHCIEDYLFGTVLVKNLLLREVRAFNHLRGISNMTEKWYLTYMQQVAAKEQGNLAERAIELFHYRSAKDGLPYIREVLSLIEDLERANRHILNQGGLMLTCEQSLDMLERETRNRKATDGPAQQHELMFRSRTYSDDAPSYAELLDIGMPNRQWA